MNSQSAIYFTVAEDLDQATALSTSHQSLCHEVFRLDLASSLEEFEIIDINDGILITECRVAVAQTTHKWQSLRQTCLTAIKCAMNFAACSCLLAFGATPGSLAPPRTVSTPNTSFRLVRTRSGSQIREFHCFLLPSPLPARDDSL